MNALLRMPLRDPDTDTVDNDVIDNLTDTPKEPAQRDRGLPKEQNKPAPTKNTSDSEARAILEDILSGNQTISLAGLQKAAKHLGLPDSYVDELLSQGQKAAEDEPKAPKKPDPEDDPINQLRREIDEDRFDDYIDRLELRAQEAMNSEDLKQYLDLHKRLNGDKADPTKTSELFRTELNNRIEAGFRRLIESNRKITREELDKIAKTAKNSLIQFMRGTIGDPTGLGRNASGKATIPGLNIPDEKTRLPSPEQAKKDPTAAKVAVQNLILKKLATLREGENIT